MIFDIRECYAHGIAKEENKRFEFHAFCECGYCKWRQKFLKEPRNCLTVTTDSIDKFPEVEAYIDNWTCGQNKRLPTQYYSLKGGEKTEKLHIQKK